LVSAVGFPHVASLRCGRLHSDTRFIRMPAVDGDRLYAYAGGPALDEVRSGHPASASTKRMLARRLPQTRIESAGSSTSRVLRVPSTANGVIYIGSDDGHLCIRRYVDPAGRVLGLQLSGSAGRPLVFECGVSADRCASAEVRRDHRQRPGVPAISNGQVYVATTSGHLINAAR
jgi:hypothetical protein